jgi:hypothetical protein
MSNLNNRVDKIERLYPLKSTFDIMIETSKDIDALTDDEVREIWRQGVIEGKLPDISKMTIEEIEDLLNRYKTTI